MDLQLVTASNLLDGTASSANLIMPTADSDGNPLSDGITCGITFGGAIATLTFVGSFHSATPTSASAGQVLNFKYSTNTSSWWNA
jgi:hypothetical protein